jgi:hypothetical protein
MRGGHLPFCEMTLRTPQPGSMSETDLKPPNLALHHGETVTKKLTMIAQRLTINFAEYFADWG